MFACFFILQVNSSPRYNKTAKPLRISALSADFFRYGSGLYLKLSKCKYSCGIQNAKA